MAVYGGQNFTSFQAVNIKGSVAIRVGGYDTNQGTLWIAPASLEANRAWSFPDKSGTFGVSGTFSVDLPVIAASGYLSTVVTVSGIRAEDGIVITPQNNGAAGAIISARGVALVGDVSPGNGNITINFVNAFATATIARTSTYAYTAVR